MPIPDGVKVSLQKGTLAMEGPKGKAELAIHPLVSVQVDEANRQILVAPRDRPSGKVKPPRQQRAMWGTVRKHIANMADGVTKGYTKQVQIVGVGYSAKIEGKNLLIRCGFANELTVPIPEGITVGPPATDSLMVTGIGQIPCTTLTFDGIDKQQVGQFAASVRRLRRPEPYKGKGIRYMNEEVKRKAGKALAAGTT